MLGNRKAQHSFARTPSVNTPRSQFDRSFNIKDTHQTDYLYPIYIDEILPGDTHNLTVHSFARLATQLAPIMDNMYLDFFFFFVPNRLVWTNWEKFCGSQDNPGDSISFTIPQITVANYTTPAVNGNSGLACAMGIPPAAGSQSVNSLPFRAYNLIYNTWFRDENIQNSVTVDTGNGPDTAANYVLRYRGKKKDYFSSCLPAPQKGTAINLLPAAAPVTRVDAAPGWKIYNALANTQPADNNLQSAGTGNLRTTASGNLSLDPNGGLEVVATAAGTINQLRQAFQVQSLLELDNRGGTRYVETILAHFNVQLPDFTAQRPEYLGGGEVRINTHIVPQTSPTSGSAYKGDLAAFATGSTGGSSRIGFTKSFVEHGYVIGLVAARADITYQQSLNKLWQRLTRYDFYWPKLEGIGEQAVLVREIYPKGTANDTTVFGYQERYAEYRYKPSEVHGYFNSGVSSNVDYWHLAEAYAGQPALNDAFISSVTPNRWQANINAPQILHDMFFTLISARPMQTYSVPVSLGRF